MGAAVRFACHGAVLRRQRKREPCVHIIYTTFLFVMLDVTYTAFDIPMGALAFSITPSGIERTKLFGVSSITRSVVGALPQVFVAGAALLPIARITPRRHI